MARQSAQSTSTVSAAMEPPTGASSPTVVPAVQVGLDVAVDTQRPPAADCDGLALDTRRYRSQRRWGCDASGPTGRRDCRLSTPCGAAVLSFGGSAAAKFGSGLAAEPHTFLPCWRAPFRTTMRRRTSTALVLILNGLKGLSRRRAEEEVDRADRRRPQHQHAGDLQPVAL
jgi:hypothetical protein